jgi:hypothetical protein
MLYNKKRKQQEFNYPKGEIEIIDPDLGIYKARDYKAKSGYMQIKSQFASNLGLAVSDVAQTKEGKIAYKDMQGKWRIYEPPADQTA